MKRPPPSWATWARKHHCRTQELGGMQVPNILGQRTPGTWMGSLQNEVHYVPGPVILGSLQPIHVSMSLVSCSKYLEFLCTLMGRISYYKTPIISSRLVSDVAILTAQGARVCKSSQSVGQAEGICFLMKATHWPADSFLIKALD